MGKKVTFDPPPMKPLGILGCPDEPFTYTVQFYRRNYLIESRILFAYGMLHLKRIIREIVLQEGYTHHIVVNKETNNET